MPELPEVETVVRELRPCLVGRRLARLRVSRLPLRRAWSATWNAALVGQTVREVSRRGKWITVGLDGGAWLLLHLGMTGQLLVQPAGEPVRPHTHLLVDLDDGQEQLRFRDVRRFGSVTLFPEREALEQFFQAAALGPEPFDLDARAWRDRLAATRRPLKAVLLDQRVVAGVGNIYADESLFEARLHPARLGCDTTAAEASRLRQALVRVLNRAIAKRGSSIRDYVGGSGAKGGYQAEFRVYQQTGVPCPRCRAPIERTRLAGRSTHYCPRCQPA